MPIDKRTRVGELDDFLAELGPAAPKPPRQQRRTEPRAVSIAAKRLSKEERTGSINSLEWLALAAEERPKMRSDCRDAERPCPFVSCRHHLYLDVNPETGTIKLNFPHVEVWDMAETCALDIADRGGVTLEEVGEILNLTRERIRQIEVRVLLKMKAVGATLR